MYEELVKRLRNQVECDKKLYPQGPPFETLLLDLAADAIEELSAYKKIALDEHNRAAKKAWEHRWISVEERLPEERKDVLVALRRGEIAVDYYQPNRWGYSDVTHWMLLPEPPKEETE